MIINGSSNYWGATSRGPVRALAVFIIYEAGLQLQPSKAFNWLISSSAIQKHKRNTILDPSRGTLSDKPTQSVSLSKITLYQPARQDICHCMHLNWKKDHFFKNTTQPQAQKSIRRKHFKHILHCIPITSLHPTMDSYHVMVQILLNSWPATVKSW